VKKVALFGPPASGKTTIARKLSSSLGLPHTNLDEILFTDAGVLPFDEFHTAAERITREDSWVVEGNYSKLADVVWHRADVLVWLDLPLLLVERRSLLRTASRKYRHNRPRYAQQVAETVALGVHVVRLRSGRQADAWLANALAGRSPAHGGPNPPRFEML
jgi:adenylate kinase family enzyme